MTMNQMQCSNTTVWRCGGVEVSRVVGSVESKSEKSESKKKRKKERGDVQDQPSYIGRDKSQRLFVCEQG